MFISSQLKKNVFIYLIAFLGVSHFAYGSIEISGHFGKKFQEYGAWHFGIDTLYRVPINEDSIFGFGPRYQFYFRPGSRRSSQSGSLSDEVMFGGALYKRNKHRVALLVNYRFKMMESLFIGAIASIDIWKYLDSDGSLNISVTDVVMMGNGITSSEFLWDNFTAQLGIEFGYKLISNLLIKLESGYDLLSFKKKCFLKRTGATLKQEIKCDIRLNGVYATVGLDYYF